ncbi:hypothetical protein Tco_0233649 [Tanacetum coccineum]
MGRQNLQTTVETHDDVDGIFDQTPYGTPNGGCPRDDPTRHWNMDGTMLRIARMMLIGTDEPKRKPKAKQNQARNGKDKVKEVVHTVLYSIIIFAYECFIMISSAYLA